MERSIDNKTGRRKFLSSGRLIETPKNEIVRRNAMKQKIKREEVLERYNQLMQNFHVKSQKISEMRKKAFGKNSLIKNKKLIFM